MGQVRAEIKTQVVQYSDGDVALEGFVAWDSAKVDKDAPGIRPATMQEAGQFWWWVAHAGAACLCGAAIGNL